MKLIFFLFLGLPLSCISQKAGRFETLEEALKNPEQVIELELWGADHRYTELPASISRLTNVKSIILRGNDLQTLPESFRDLISLEELSLGNNQHLKVGEVCLLLSSLPNLKSLDLESTGLTELPEEIMQLKGLKELYLGLNKLPPSALEELRKLMPDVTIYD